jgi:hypothetical protein
LYVRANPVENWWKAILAITIVSTLYTLRLGTHVEGQDPSGGEVVDDFDPRTVEYALEFAKTTVALSWGAVVGAIAGPK